MLSVEEISVFLYLQMNHLHALTPKGKKPNKERCKAILITKKANGLL